MRTYKKVDPGLIEEIKAKATPEKSIVELTRSLSRDCNRSTVRLIVAEHNLPYKKGFTGEKKVNVRRYDKAGRRIFSFDSFPKGVF